MMGCARLSVATHSRRSRPFDRDHTNVVVKVFPRRKATYPGYDGWKKLLQRQRCTAVQTRDQGGFAEFFTFRRFYFVNAIGASSTRSQRKDYNRAATVGKGASHTKLMKRSVLEKGAHISGE